MVTASEKSELELLKQENLRLRKLLDEASVDTLTGLAGRRQFEHRIAEEFSNHHHHPERHFSIFIVDLDHLKKVNDNHGHPAGDRMIVEFGQLFKKLMREYDMVARIGGDEFGAILPGENKEGAEMVKQRLLQKFEEFKDSMLYFSGVSIGVASTSEGLGTFDEMYTEADKKMYAHKNATRGFLLVRKTA